MASRREFKKDLNQILSEVIEECYFIQKSSDEKKSKKAEKLIDGAIDTFDQLIGKVYQKGVEDQKSHFRAIRAELEKSVSSMQKEIESLKN
jgi:flagellar biosynthesis/type III secretory pathway protein FliH